MILEKPGLGGRKGANDHDAAFCCVTIRSTLEEAKQQRGLAQIKAKSRNDSKVGPTSVTNAR